jgi:DegV family protein with EDD domain
MQGLWSAAAEARGPVEVVDSGSTGMGWDFPRLAAAAAAAAGGDLAGVRDAAMRAIENTSTFFYVDTLEHLRRGGRITAVSALLGTALAVKPLLEVVKGQITLRDKVRTAGRALDRLAAIAMEAAATALWNSRCTTSRRPPAPTMLTDTLCQKLGERVKACYTSEVGAVVAAHVGPGLAGVVVHRL